MFSVLNATADAQAGEVLRDSRSMIAAAVQRHQRAVAWAAAVWRLQRLRTLPFWQVDLINKHSLRNASWRTVFTSFFRQVSLLLCFAWRSMGT